MQFSEEAVFHSLQRLSHDVSNIVFSIGALHLDDPLVDIDPDDMVPEVDMLGPLVSDLIVHRLHSTLGIREHMDWEMDLHELVHEIDCVQTVRVGIGNNNTFSLSR